MSSLCGLDSPARYAGASNEINIRPASIRSPRQSSYIRTARIRERTGLSAYAAGATFTEVARTGHGC